MEKIAIVTDSTADLPREFAQEKKITIVPLKVNFGQETFTEGLDITNEEFFIRLEEEEELPTTSQPSPADFARIYQELLAEGYESIISIHLSDKLSGTRQSAELAHSLLGEKIKNFKAIDSSRVTIGIGMLAIKAREAAVAGKSFQEIIAEVEELKDQLNLYGLVDTLKYLEKGGRIGRARLLLEPYLILSPFWQWKMGLS